MIFKSEYTCIKVIRKKSIIEQMWESVDEMMSIDLFKAEMEVFFDLYKLSKYQKFCINARKFNYVIDVDLQEWVGDTFKPGLISTVNKAAIVLPDDTFTEISIRQTVEELSENENKSGYFKNSNKAYNWLLN
ncbi:MAG: hypothetical protein GY756_13150 [bacterium]|nr:hypothetical protein [bacterium]